jgi:hypothetical protein
MSVWPRADFTGIWIYRLNRSAAYQAPLLAFTGLWQSLLLAGHHPANMPSEAVMRIGSVIIIVWLIIGAIAGGQRHYYGSSDPKCARAGTIIVTVLAGPLNYTGVNPKISCKVPQPSK